MSGGMRDLLPGRGPTPTGPHGAPLIVRPAERMKDLAARADAGTPLLGARHRVDGRELVETTFLWRPDRDPAPGQAAPQVMVHLNALTDRHREDVRNALLRQVPGTPWQALTYLLPPEAMIGYRLVARERIPRDVGADRAGWGGIHRDGRPDPRCRALLREGMGQADSSLSIGPEAPVHPDWEGEARPGPGPFRVLEAGEPDGEGRWAMLLLGQGSGPRRLLILLDGATWQLHDLPTRWAGRAGSWDVLLLDSGSPAVRARDLPHVERIAPLVAARVAQAQTAAGRTWVPEQRVVAGQSFGGLAAASIAVHRPDVARWAISQSGSFWFGSPDEPGEGEGALIASLRSGRAHPAPGARILLQVGSEEGSMVAGTRTMAALLGERGALLAAQEVTGGG